MASVKGVAAIWLLLLLSSCPPFCLVIPAFGQPGLLCVEFGQTDHTRKYQTIGAGRFKPKDLALLGPFAFTYYNTTYPFWELAWTDPNWRKKGCPDGMKIDWNRIRTFLYHDYCPKDIEIRAYLVRQNGRILNGWLHIEVELTDPKDEMEYIFVQARDEYFNAVGEFVTNEDEQCSSASKEGLISPSKYQVLPCSVIGLREAKAAQGMFLAKRTQYANRVDERYLPKEELKKGIHFTWRLNEYWCNRHEQFRFDAYVWTTNKRNLWNKATGSSYNSIKGVNVHFKHCDYKNFYCRLQRKVTDYWLHAKWFGAADIKNDGPLDCTTNPAIDFKSGALTPDTWLARSSLMTVGTDYETWETTLVVKGTRYLKSCNVVVGPNAPSFGGRCEKHLSNDKRTSRYFLQGCIHDATADEFKDLDTSTFVVYSEYVNEINHKRLKQCNQTCEEPNDSEDLRDIQSFQKSDTSQEKYKAPVYFKTLRDARLVARANTFFQTRKYHGNLCIFITMFFLPVSNFLIRYYKETFMHNLSLGCAPWLWVHMFVCFAVPTFYRSSYSALQESALNYGVSESAQGTFHRWCGHCFVVVLLLMIVLGGIRPMIRGSRLLCMTLHSVTGFVLYFVAIILVINSTYIPASPTVDKCDKKTGAVITTELSYTAKMTVRWFFIDLLFHLGLTTYQFVLDNKYEIKRSGFGLPIVPILPATAWQDLRGSAVRKIVLVVYVGLSLAMTFTTISELFWDDDQKGCSLGNMTCDLTELRPNMSSSPFGCYSVSLRYYALVFGKYDIKFNETIV